jgi:MFS transporter, PPP family, 3-phenylpropionic acid transporter
VLGGLGGGALSAQWGLSAVFWAATGAAACAVAAAWRVRHWERAAVV